MWTFMARPELVVAFSVNVLLGSAPLRQLRCFYIVRCFLSIKRLIFPSDGD